MTTTTTSRYRGYDIVPTRQWSQWCVGIYPTRADLPILARSTLSTMAPQEGSRGGRGQAEDRPHPRAPGLSEGLSQGTTGLGPRSSFSGLGPPHPSAPDERLGGPSLVLRSEKPRSPVRGFFFDVPARPREPFSRTFVLLLAAVAS